MQQQLLNIFICACIITSCNNGEADKKTTNNGIESITETTDTGWVNLFDGTSTNGWHSYGKASIGSAWKVAEGSLYLDTTKKEGWQISDGGDIVSNNEYENFHLKLDWKVAPGGNSGIIFFVHEDTSEYDFVWQTGPEMQVLDNAAHPDAKIVKHRAGDLYDLISCSVETVKPAGEWNAAEIITQNATLTFILNGTVVVKTTLWDDRWSQIIASSKFNSMPGFGTFKKGKLALQDHGNAVWFRNIQIKEL
ncbi:MAG: DUF1080 domain-containing protein [Ferruginibacter sp.]